MQVRPGKVHVICGENGAAHVYGPQKGATPEMVGQLDRRAQLFAEKSALHFGFDRSAEPGAGAAGGLGYAFMQYFGAEMKSGADLLLDLIGGGCGLPLPYLQPPPVAFRRA